MKNVSALVIAAMAIIYGGSGHAQTGKPQPSPKVVGVWFDSLLRCNVYIEETAGRFSEILRECKSAPTGQGDIELERLLKIGANSFRPDARPRKSWHLVIAASGDLEVRDSEGVVRTLASTAPKTDRQTAAQRKSEGATIGMTAGEVLQTAWGKPVKVNRTVTANAITEQWVYRSGYLYFTNGLLTAIQN